MTRTLPADQNLAARRCASCPKMCRGVCPTLEATRNERHQPWGHAVEDVAACRSADAGGEGFAGTAVSESAYMCATCAACTVPCEVEGVETPELVWAVRAAVWESGAAPPAARAAVEAAAGGRVPTVDDPAGWTDPAATLAALRPLATPDAALMLFPGCGALGRRPSAVLAAARALTALGVEFSVPAVHRCCGAVALAAGDTDGSRLAALAMRRDAATAGAKRVAVQSPSCAAHLVRQDRLPAEDGGKAPQTAVVSLAEVLADALVERRPTRGSHVATRSGVVYHDPCMLARHLGVRDAPRAALTALDREVSELPRHGRLTRCSGRGGLLAQTHPDIAAGYLELLAADVRATGAGSLVTGCASCAAALAAALPDVDVADLAETVDAALQGPTTS